MITSILLIISWIYILIGIFGIFKFKNLFYRILSSAIIDTVASLTILISLMFYIKDISFILKIILLILFILITNPISNHVIVRSSFLSGITIKKGDNDGNTR